MNEGLGELRVSQTLFYVTGNFVPSWEIDIFQSCKNFRAAAQCVGEDNFLF